MHSLITEGYAVPETDTWQREALSEDNKIISRPITRGVVPANIFEPERRSGKYCLSQPGRWYCSVFRFGVEYSRYSSYSEQPYLSESATFKRAKNSFNLPSNPFTRDSICYSAYMLSPVCLSVCPSDGWIIEKNWSWDYEIFTVR